MWAGFEVVIDRVHQTIAEKGQRRTCEDFSFEKQRTFISLKKEITLNIQCVANRWLDHRWTTTPPSSHSSPPAFLNDQSLWLNLLQNLLSGLAGQRGPALPLLMKRFSPLKSEHMSQLPQPGLTKRNRSAGPSSLKTWDREKLRFKIFIKDDHYLSAHAD